MLSLRPVLADYVQLPAFNADTMNRLPEEVILHILSFLDIADIVHLQRVSCRYLTLGRDNALWKAECFTHSRAEAFRRRQHLLSVQEAHIAELRNAVTALPGGDLTAWDVSQLVGRSQQTASTDPAAAARTQRSRALASWEPNYPNERIDYHAEYIQRHAPNDVAWLRLPKAQGDQVREATGAGLLADQQDSSQQHVIAPLDDGGVCIWDVSARSTTSSGGAGRLIARSKAGLLTGQSADSVSQSHTIMTETGAVECVAIDSAAQKAYMAVQNHLHELDLSSLQLVSTKEYPFPITALSQTSGKTPITVGTNMTIHLHDPRDPAYMAHETPSAGELIGGSVYSHATLAQPGPLSILNHDGFTGDDSSIWVAGRFTSLLNYDRRFFPRLRGTVFSGARIASLFAMPQPFIPRSLDLMRNPNVSSAALLDAKQRTGTTVLAAAEYKGKGSLELYGLPDLQSYQNRQTASASKLLSAVAHGGRIVFSDGDGHLKWMERDGFTHVRTFNINDAMQEDLNGAQDASTFGIWSSTASEMPGQGDIVQKIIPTRGSQATISSELGRPDINQDKLLLWTGDGRLGILGIGQSGPLGSEVWHDAMESQAKSAEEMAREDAARQYSQRMRRALERNADEVRFVRGLGIGSARS
ncbi:hypothetical protein DOTSEDRAFT_70502 [Dothistroma septosporum NZE10]|uniref:F-box domain-containing protein n=1 Tax=Dothistroma septosporum (strain NZE10 / CBS 128990) TaxID=675120 RepID=N1PT12_DOTSN|nr:hypothetical protein DOTSEDRAFT_70502 [Dothistroma septosporum NZE10]